MRSLLWILNIAALIALSFLAKDNLVALLKDGLPSQISLGSKNVSSDGTIEVIFSPRQGATAAIINAIAEARSSILVAAYSFTSAEIAKALLDAKNREIEIHIILDKSQLSQTYSSSRFFINQGFKLKIDKKHAIFHNKFIIIDNKTVVTGSFNFTKAAEERNAENVLIIRNNKELAHLYAKNFWFHWNNSSRSFDKKHAKPDLFLNNMHQNCIKKEICS